jgi:hypothetical protein
MRTAPISTRVADREPNIGYVRTRPSLAKEQLGGAGCVFGIDIVRMLAVVRVLAPGIDRSEVGRVLWPVQGGEQFDVVVC